MADNGELCQSNFPPAHPHPHPPTLDQPPTFILNVYDYLGSFGLGRIFFLPPKKIYPKAVSVKVRKTFFLLSVFFLVFF
jgi:hypothetical protein